MRRRKNVFLTLWLSYLLILVIPVTIFAGLYTNIENTMVDNANRSNLAMLEQVRQVVDNNMQEIDQLTIQIATHPKLQTLWNIKEGERYIEYSEAVMALKNIRSGSGFIGDFYIHLRNQDIIFSPNLKTDTKTFFTKISPYANKNVDEIKTKLLSGYHFKTFWPSEAILDGALSKNIIASVISLPLGESENVRATLVVQIDEQQIFNLLKQIEWANSATMYIVDASGQVLLSTAENNELPEGLPSGMQETDYRTFKYNGQDMMLSYTNGEGGWKYISLIPEKVVLQGIHKMTGWAISLLIIALIGGTAVAYWMAYRSYSPIREMVLTLMNGKDDKASVAVNEYEFIKTAIAQNLAEGVQMRHILASHAPVARAHFLTRLLKGHTGHEPFDQNTMDFMGIQMPYDYSCVVLISIEDSSKFMKEDREEEWALVQFILYNLSSELIKGKGYVVETERNQLALLLNVPGSLEVTVKERDSIILQLKQIIEERFHMKITIVSSSIHTGTQQFGKSYREASSALDYRIIHGTGSVIHYDQVKDMERSYYHYPIEIELQMMNYLKSGNYEQAVSLLDELYEQNMASGVITPEMSKYLFIDLLSTILKVINALNIDGNQFFHGADPVRHIVDSKSTQEMQQKIKELSQLICCSVREARTDQNDILNDHIKKYINEHYLDNGLSLTSIAENLGMTPQYISGFFKKQNCINLTEYISDIRIREAKKLLAESSSTMLQIAQKVGYATDTGFIRVFKKQEGITPGKYREMVTGTEG